MTAPGSISIVIADDHPVVRSGLRTLLEAESDIEVMAEAADSAEAVRKVRAHRPDVLICDLAMPGPPVVDAIESLSTGTEAAPTAVVILTMHADPAHARAALRAGANGYILKEAAQSTLVRVVRQVAAGGTYLDPELGVQLARGCTDDVPPDGLTGREAKVVGLVALGHTSQEVAEMLSVSVRTVEAHRTRIQQKLEFSSRAELVRYALDNGLTEPALELILRARLRCGRSHVP